MGLDMKDKKKICGEIAKRYQKAGKAGRKRGRRPKYQGMPFKALPEGVRSLFDRLCGKLLAPMLRLMPDFLTAEYSLAPEMRDMPASVSPRAIDRILKPVKDKGRLRGLSLTKGGTLLRNQIPVRVMFNRDGRKPGFFEFDRVARCGANASGQFCQTLTGTGAGSGWTEEHALLNSAHLWVKERCPKINLAERGRAGPVSPPPPSLP